MRIILDSNVLMSESWAFSARFRALRDYASVSKSTILLPQIVREEVTGKYLDWYRQACDRLKANRRELDEHLAKLGVTVLALPSLPDPGDVLARFQSHLSDIDSNLHGEALPYKDGMLGDLVSRLIHRVKPASQKGEEARDVLLWLSILEYLKTTKEDKSKPCFISGNTKDFGDGNGGLHKDLAEDLRQRGLDLKYYPGLEGFLKEHNEPIAFIRDEWIRNAVKIEELRVELKQKAESDPLVVAGHASLGFSGIPVVELSAFQLESLHVWTPARDPGLADFVANYSSKMKLGSLVDVTNLVAVWEDKAKGLQPRIGSRPSVLVFYFDIFGRADKSAHTLVDSKIDKTFVIPQSVW
ncbi:MAG: DUF4935 domain-containing protein [Planctomycetes bacterium]|nr:DUF4935 domain-containing protein [Planctomycetota bacterium]